MKLLDSRFRMHSISIPSCGQSICDDPYLASAYSAAASSGNLEELTIGYEAHVLSNGDGTNPQVSLSSTSFQHAVLNDAFAAAGIKWEGHIVTYNDSSYRSRVVLPGCRVDWIGDLFCDSDCDSVYTGYDGGDCSALHATSACPSRALLGNGVCDSACNFASADWDGGDCCFSGATACRDPHSPYRVWWTGDELKQVVNRRGDTHLNFFLFTPPSDMKVLGLSTFPWLDAYAYGPFVNGGMYGGSLISASAWGCGQTTCSSASVSKMQGKTAVHEAGHAMGLWHTFHGVSETQSTAGFCADSCREDQPSSSADMSTWTSGDLCADTRPTPVNYDCGDPPLTCKDTGRCKDCHGRRWVNTPFNNYMGYGSDACITSFTPNQMGRVRCYIDLAFPKWIDDPRPSTIVLPPRLSLVASRAISFSWFPPLRTGAVSPSQLLTYRVERSPAFSSALTTLNVTVSDAAAPSLSDSDVQPNTTYTYRVRAIAADAVAQHDSPALTVTSLPCDAGQEDVSGVCVACALGLYSSAVTGGRCVAAPIGFYATLNPPGLALPCPRGTFSSSPGSLVCAPCPDGFTTLSTASSSCVSCAAYPSLSCATSASSKPPASFVAIVAGASAGAALLVAATVLVWWIAVRRRKRRRSRFAALTASTTSLCRSIRVSSMKSVCPAPTLPATGSSAADTSLPSTYTKPPTLAALRAETGSFGTSAYCISGRSWTSFVAGVATPSVEGSTRSQSRALSSSVVRLALDDKPNTSADRDATAATSTPSPDLTPHPHSPHATSRPHSPSFAPGSPGTPPAATRPRPSLDNGSTLPSLDDASIRSKRARVPRSVSQRQTPPHSPSLSSAGPRLRHHNVAATVSEMLTGSRRSPVHPYPSLQHAHHVPLPSPVPLAATPPVRPTPLPISRTRTAAEVVPPVRTAAAALPLAIAATPAATPSPAPASENEGRPLPAPPAPQHLPSRRSSATMPPDDQRPVKRSQTATWGARK